MDGRQFQDLAAHVREHAFPLIGSLSDWDTVLDEIGGKSIVLLGEATHGTHEFYRARSEITQRLIEEKGFSAIAIEADWPDALALNDFIHHGTSTAGLMKALGEFKRFPMWMWRNSDVLKLVEWLWTHNRKESTAHQVSLFGIDLYSLYKSMREVVTYLDKIDPAEASRVRELYSCFDKAGSDPVHYGRLVRIGAQPSCQQGAIEAARTLFAKNSFLEARLTGSEEDEDALFFAQRHANLVRGAESYYRNLFSPLVNTWNVRDQHMAETVNHVLRHLDSQGRPAKVVIWAHNSHVGDDRATEMGERGQLNIGQLLREQHPGDTFTLGFTTYAGTVMAAREWDQPPDLRTIRPALPGSIEELFHEAKLDAFLLPLTGRPVSGGLSEEFLERAIGVIYANESEQSERESHYFYARLTEQFDAVVHYDQTREVEPLDRLSADELAAPSPIQF